MVFSRSSGDTVALGRSLGSALKPGDVVAICGMLGTGKTTFVTGVCEALGVRAHVASPSFAIINEYASPSGPVVHIDLYRVESREEIADLGIDQYFTDRTICLIEWAEHIIDLLPEHRYLVSIHHGSFEEERHVSIQAPIAGDLPDHERRGVAAETMRGKRR
jgi:tRNA threonylcarbamoyladenosine biosynthesis protein TsaE